MKNALSTQKVRCRLFNTIPLEDKEIPSKRKSPSENFIVSMLYLFSCENIYTFNVRTFLRIFFNYRSRLFILTVLVFFTNAHSSHQNFNCNKFNITNIFQVSFSPCKIHKIIVLNYKVILFICLSYVTKYQYTVNKNVLTDGWTIFLYCTKCCIRKCNVIPKHILTDRQKYTSNSLKESNVNKSKSNFPFCLILNYMQGLCILNCS